MGVALGSRQRRVPEHFLHRTQVGTSLQQVSRRRVPQTMGGDVMNTGTRRHLMHHRTHDTRIESAALFAKEESVTAPLCGQLRAASHQPMIERVGGRRPVGNHPLFISFTDDTHGQGLSVQRGDVEGSHLRHA